MYDEFAKGIPAHLTFRQRCALMREHQFYERVRAGMIVALLIGSMFVFGGFTGR